MRTGVSARYWDSREAGAWPRSARTVNVTDSLLHPASSQQQTASLEWQPGRGRDGGGNDEGVEAEAVEIVATTSEAGKRDEQSGGRAGGWSDNQCWKSDRRVANRDRLATLRARDAWSGEEGVGTGRARAWKQHFVDVVEQDRAEEKKAVEQEVRTWQLVSLVVRFEREMEEDWTHWLGAGRILFGAQRCL